MSLFEEHTMPDLLAEDFVTVQQAISSPAIKDLQEKILSGNATNAEIEQHYRTFDAIDSQTSFESKKATYLHMKSLGRVAFADFVGGAQMVSGVLAGGSIAANGGYNGILSAAPSQDTLTLIQHSRNVGSIDDSDIGRFDTLEDHAHSPATSAPLKHLAERVGLIQQLKLMDILDDAVVTQHDALKALSLGRTIMREGSRALRLQMDILSALPRGLGSLDIMQSMRDIDVAMTSIDITESPAMTTSLSDLIMRSCGYAETVEAKNVLLNELKVAFGPALSWPTGESYYRILHKGQYIANDPSYTAEIQKLGFVAAFNNITHIANFAKAHDAHMLQKGRIKGSLHEALWMLDAYAIRKGMPDRYGEYVVDVATEAEDMPFLNRPIMKRGVDFVIRKQLDSEKRRLIQVGASRKKVKNQTEKPYHPTIELYCEKEFNEVNIPTLEARIHTYKTWAQNGFTQQDFAKLKIHDKILGTVKDAFAVHS